MDLSVMDKYHEELEVEVVDEESVFAPFGKFFDDDFFLLIYTNPGVLPANLRVLKNKLKVVSDKQIKELSRSKAALHLGREIVKRADTRDALVPKDFDCAVRWFDLAIQFNSVEAAADLALLYLSKSKLQLKCDTNTSLPEFKQINSDREIFNDFDEQAEQTWYRGARLTFRYIQSKFWGWNQSTFQAAFTCILAFLISTPRRAESAIVASSAEKRMKELLWIKPLWSRLVHASALLEQVPKEYIRKKFEQFEAALLILNNQRGYDAEMATCEKLSHFSPSVGVLEVLVIPGEIPRSSDRSETDFLKQYEVLRSPIALTAMPDLDRLYTIWETLSAEFPWAEDVVSAVLSELFARKRHGAVILGMSPLLLVGLPGCGKTRFSRRVSNLLSTPNTVINMAGMSDVKVLKGVTRGWASNRSSRIVEFMAQTKTANPFFILDEVDKTGCHGGHGGDPQEALLDLLEPGNAGRYQDIYLMTECDLSHCMYIATSNSLEKLPQPLLSRLRIVYFPEPGPEHFAVIVKGMIRDLEQAWRLPEGTISLGSRDKARLKGLPLRQMRHVLLEVLGHQHNKQRFVLH